MAITVRLLQETDAPALWNLRTEALTAEPRSFGEAVEEHLRFSVDSVATRLREGPPNNFVVGAFADGALAGMAGFGRHTGVKRLHKGFVWGMYVNQSLRGQGIGRALLEKLLQTACALDDLHAVTLSVRAENLPALALYRAVGFQDFGTELGALRVGEELIAETFMRYEIRR
jgi:ribosomal protein S18 acetylase RimI-like enzyme